jgi:hypothetical protein
MSQQVIEIEVKAFFNKRQLAKRVALRKFIEENSVQPRKHILPSIIAEWNAKKGGVDNLFRSLCQLKGKFESALGPTQRLILDQMKISLLQAFHSPTGKNCTDAIEALDMWMAERGDRAETERRQQIETEKGLKAVEIASPNSPTPNINISYNHRKSWSNDKLFLSCILKEKGRFLNLLCRLIVYLILQQNRGKMPHNMMVFEGRKCCVLCCRLCF